MTLFTKNFEGYLYVIEITSSQVIVKDYSGECFRTSKMLLPSIDHLTELIRIYNLGVYRDQENYQVAIRNTEGKLLFIEENFNCDESYDYYINLEAQTFRYNSVTMSITDVNLITPEELINYYNVE